MADHTEKGLLIRAFSWEMQDEKTGQHLAGCKVTLGTKPDGQEYNLTKGYVLSDYSCSPELFQFVSDSMTGKQVLLHGELVRAGKNFKFRPSSIELAK